jgi:hypothetical protein
VGWRGHVKREEDEKEWSGGRETNLKKKNKYKQYTVFFC